MKNPRNQGSELSNATIVPQYNVVANIARGEDELNLMPANAAGAATPTPIGHVHGTEMSNRMWMIAHTSSQQPKMQNMDSRALRCRICTVQCVHLCSLTSSNR